MKVGIIRCQQTEDLCCGASDFRTAAAGEGNFQGLTPVEIVGFVSCGGCPGTRAVARAKSMIEDGAQAILLASCIGKKKPYGFACPNLDRLKKSIRGEVGETVKVLDYTHE